MWTHKQLAPQEEAEVNYSFEVIFLFNVNWIRYNVNSRSGEIIGNEKILVVFF